MSNTIKEFLKSKNPEPPKSSVKSYLSKFNKDNASQEAEGFKQYSEGVDASLEDNTFFSNTSESQFLDGSESDLGNIDLNELKAQTQPWVYKFGAGVGRVAVKTLSEVAKMPGMAGGLIAAPFMNDDAVETIFNNSWIRAIENFNETINDEALPVYVKKSIQEGNIIDNMFSIDFWATEGADGLGYIASMMVPGVGLSKLGIGSKIMKNLYKGGKAVTNTEKAGKQMFEIAENAQKMLGNGTTINAKNIDILNATLANTFFEAGAEAGGAMRSYEETMATALANGEISAEEYKQRKGELGRNIFWENVGVLLGPNLITNKILLGGAKSNFKADDFFKKGKFVDEIATETTKAKINRYGQEWGKGLMREGFWEEAMQSTFEKYETNRAMGVKDGGLVDTYLDVVSSTEGQKAILLGGLFGGTMNVYSGYRGDKASEVNKSNILSAMKKGINFFEQNYTDIYKKNDDGSYVMKDGNKVIDESKRNDFIKYLKQLDEINTINDALGGDFIDKEDLNISKTQAKAIHNVMKDSLVANVIMPFITEGEVGLEVLERKLNSMNDLKNRVEDYNEAFNLNTNSKKFISELMEIARDIQKDYQTGQNLFRDIIDVKTKDASKEQVDRFYNNLIHSYAVKKAQKRSLLKQKDIFNDRIQDYIQDRYNNFDFGQEEFENYEGEFTIDVFQDRILAKDPLYKRYTKERDAFDKEINNINSFLNDIYTPEKLSESFKTWKVIDDVQTAETSEENARRADEHLNKANKAKTEGDLNKVQKEVEDDKNLPKNGKKGVVNRVKEKIASLKNSKKEAANENAKEVNDKNIVYKKGDIFYAGRKNGPRDITKEYTVDFDENGNLLMRDHNGNPDPMMTELAKVGIKYDNGRPKEASEDNQAKNDTAEDYEVESNSVKVVGEFEDGTVAPYIPQEYIDYVNNGEKKEGDKVTFSVNTEYNEANAKKAIKLLEMLDPKEVMDHINGVKKNADIQKHLVFIANHLPIITNFKPGIYSFLRSQYQGDNTKSKAIWEKVERRFRQRLVKAYYENGGTMEGLSTTIQHQNNGQIQLSPKVEGNIPENSILGLEGVNSIDDVHLFTPMNKVGNIKDESDKKTKAITINNARSNQGSVFMSVTLPNGNTFPLKLNVKKINSDQAKSLFNLISELAKEGVTPSTTMDVLPEGLQDEIKDKFSKEIELFTIPFEDIQISELFNLMLYDGTDSEHEFKLTGSALKMPDRTVNYQALKQFETKILNFLTNEKRQQISFKTLAGKTNIDKTKYKQYLIDNNILNTDANIDGRLFAGSNLFLDMNVSIDPKSNNATSSNSNSNSNQSQIDDIERRRQEELKSNSTSGVTGFFVYDLTEPKGSVNGFWQQGIMQLGVSALEILLKKEYKEAQHLIKLWAESGMSIAEIGKKLNERYNVKGISADLNVLRAEKIYNEINAKYDAEIEALTKATSVKTPSTESIEQQKADIEARRQEELENSVLSEGELELARRGASEHEIANYQSSNYLARDGKGVLKEFNEINAKYDAELAALNNSNNTSNSQNNVVNSEPDYSDETEPQPVIDNSQLQMGKVIYGGMSVEELQEILEITEEPQARITIREVIKDLLREQNNKTINSIKEVNEAQPAPESDNLDDILGGIEVPDEATQDRMNGMEDWDQDYNDDDIDINCK